MSENLGLCASPDSSPEDRIIWINPTVDKEQIINSIVHEVIHSEVWCLDEQYVANLADSITALLKQSGALNLAD